MLAGKRIERVADGDTRWPCRNSRAADRRAALELDADDAHGAGTSVTHEAVVVDRDDRAGGHVGTSSAIEPMACRRVFVSLRAPSPAGEADVRGTSPWPPATAAVPGSGCGRPRAGRFQSTRLSDAFQPLGVRHAVLVLRRFLDRSRPRAGRPSRRAGRRRATASRDFELGARLVRADVDAVRRQHRPGIEGRNHAHDRDARLAIAGENRAMNGRRAAPARQERRVDVDHAEPRNGQERAPAESARTRRRPRGPGRSPRACRGTPARGAAPAAAPEFHVRPRTP